MMRSVIKPTFTLFSMCLLALNGCAYGPGPYHGGYGSSPYGASPYGSGYQGGVYPGGYQQAPIQTLQPGQQYVPNGTVVPGGVYPGSSGSPTYQGDGGGLQPIPNPSGASNDAPPYSSSTEIKKPVPDPSNPNGSPFYNNSTSRTFQPPINANEIQPASMDEPVRNFPGQLRESNLGTPASPNSTYNPPTAAAPIAPISPISPPMGNAIDINQPAPSAQEIPPASFGNDPFNSPPPISSQPEPEPEPAPRPAPLFGSPGDIKANKPVQETTSTFGHDQNFKWLRGVVSKDEPTGTWCVVYSDNPQQSDKFAGHLSLAKSPYLSSLNDGDVIQVKGEVDPVMKDPLGKPVYLVSHLETITKAPSQP